MENHTLKFIVIIIIATAATVASTTTTTTITVESFPTGYSEIVC